MYVLHFLQNVTISGLQIVGELTEISYKMSLSYVQTVSETGIMVLLQSLEHIFLRILVRHFFPRRVKIETGFLYTSWWISFQSVSQQVRIFKISGFIIFQGRILVQQRVNKCSTHSERGITSFWNNVPIVFSREKSLAKVTRSPVHKGRQHSKRKGNESICAEENWVSFVNSVNWTSQVALKPSLL